MRIAVLVSGGGTNLQALIDNEAGDFPPEEKYEIALVIADRKDIYAIERAEKHKLPCELVLSPSGIPRSETRRIISDRILELARRYDIDALVLAGFLTILNGDIISEYSGRIINLHPALLPRYGGKGMWGHHVHEAVLAADETESGCTVHLVDAGCDTGPVLLQKKVPVFPGDTAQTLAERISHEEHSAIVEGTRLLAKRLRK
ncbi:phosphoribosylglycinamide formyltransferase [Brucepastera parasyntrophica]|uniref:phosphoribosylglycinamide formyltransferase n=1 Tax=Brucepastera parasyntrophica TaxID=2880008 RepID=UPI00210AA604|nr:phosphoribosylglycinamide formyltransferase [Brucepastera parasyntrophica]ULQ59153.1 phosphoribosylglycinamide formyltransferase [Brucepastera parasyntrophica]